MILNTIKYSFHNTEYETSPFITNIKKMVELMVDRDWRRHILKGQKQ